MPDPDNPDEAECRICHDTGIVPFTERLCSCRTTPTATTTPGPARDPWKDEPMPVTTTHQNREIADVPEAPLSLAARVFDTVIGREYAQRSDGLWCGLGGVETMTWDHLRRTYPHALVLLTALADPTANGEGAKHKRGHDTEWEAAQFAMPTSGSYRHKALMALAEAEDGLTDRELEEATGVYLYTIAPRRLELCHMGWVQKSEKRRRFKDDPKALRAIVWELTPEGRDLLSTVGAPD